MTVGLGNLEKAGFRVAARLTAKVETTATFNGVTVIQNTKLINPNLLDDIGRTNLQRMENGLTPIGPDGKSLNLHHVNQTMSGGVKELTATFHQQNYAQLHAKRGQASSNIDRASFGTWRAAYWINRSDDF